MDPNAPDVNSLQFRKAEIAPEPAGPACGMCKRPIEGNYYHVAGIPCCAACSEARLAAQQQTGGVSHFGRALLFGLGAAIAGSILWALVAAVLHVQLALLSILIGYMVGKAMVYGSGGWRTRKFQIAAVCLTYLSIGGSYVLIALTSIKSLANVSLLKVLEYSFAAPLIDIFSEGAGGILTALIIFFGLSRAWRYTRPDEVAIIGPYPVSDLRASKA